MVSSGWEALISPIRQRSIRYGRRAAFEFWAFFSLIRRPKGLHKLDESRMERTVNSFDPGVFTMSSLIYPILDFLPLFPGLDARPVTMNSIRITRMTIRI